MNGSYFGFDDFQKTVNLRCVEWGLIFMYSVLKLYWFSVFWIIVGNSTMLMLAQSYVIPDVQYVSLLVMVIEAHSLILQAMEIWANTL